MAKEVIFEGLERRIFIFSGHRVMMDSDLAVLYGVTTKRLNEQVKRNIKRFPVDFMFRLTPRDTANLKSQIATSSFAHGGRRYRPLVFTEQGVAMLSGILQSDRAIRVNIAIMRAFVRLREMMAGHKELAKQLAELEKKYDSQFRVVFEAIRQLMADGSAGHHRIAGAKGHIGFK